MALSADRNTPEKDGVMRDVGVAATAVCYAGGLACRNATGYATPGATATTLKAIGRFEETVDNSAGADGAVTVKVKKGVFRFANSAAGDAIAAADIGNDCYIVDDETVAKTDGTGTRSIAGKIFDVDAQGVWVAVG
ncbi:MAG: hypothetical protein HQL35_04925 [Alphaproteobacteria bacterium]|nr:hypothetical protein [Alphaproteobacteria bacterium]